MGRHRREKDFGLRDEQFENRLREALEHARRADALLNELLFEHGEDEQLAGAAEHSRCLVWYLRELRNDSSGPGGSGQ